MLLPRLRALSIILFASPWLNGCAVGIEMIGGEILQSMVQGSKATSTEPNQRVVIHANYQVSADTNRILKSLSGGKAAVTALLPPASDLSDCRAAGPVPIVNQLSIPQFISNAMNAELKSAELYDETGGAKWTGEVTKIVLSTNPLLESGWWELAMRIKSDTGAVVIAESKLSFAVGTDAHKACDLLAPQALGPATQVLLRNLVAHPSFSQLLRR